MISLLSSSLVPQSGSGLPGHVFSSRSYFFDNPRRYDSDDDLAWSVMPQNIQARLNPPPKKTPQQSNHQVGMWQTSSFNGLYVCFCSLAADSYEWGSQSSGISAYIGGDDSYHLPPPPEELSHY